MKIKLLVKQVFPADRGWSRTVIVTRDGAVHTYRVEVKRMTPLWIYRGTVRGRGFVWSGAVPGNIGVRGLLDTAGVVPHRERTI